MRYLFDTNSVIYYFNGLTAAAAFPFSTSGERMKRSNSLAKDALWF